MGNSISRQPCAIDHLNGRLGERLKVLLEPMDAHMDMRFGLVVSVLLSNAFGRFKTDLFEVRMSQLSGGGLRITKSDHGLGILNDMPWPSTITLSGQMVIGLIEGLAGTMQVGRRVVGSYVTIDVPTGAVPVREDGQIRPETGSRRS